MIHELRIYDAMPGRLNDLHRRFTDLTIGIWERLGIRPIGFWNTLVGPTSNSLYYLLEWRNLAEREQKWKEFASDPQWLAGRIESEREGAIISSVQNIFLAPTDFFKIPQIYFKS